MERAGLLPDDFDLVTTYEDFGCAKPSRPYFEGILARIGARPEECLMVGNDTHDYMAAAALGMQVFLVTDNLLNPRNLDIHAFPHGDFAKMCRHVLAFANGK
jgi:FMN phosphatase YigB (HAD superfamily)